MTRDGCVDGTTFDGIAPMALAEDRPRWDRPWLLALALVALTCLAYQPVWRAGFVWDDDVYVTNNASLRTLDGLRRIWFESGRFEFGTTLQYYPLTYTTFWVEYHLWRLDPLGYHVINVLFHAFNAVLAWLILRKLRVNGAWLAAAIFAVHPVHVESVAWITERKNVLSGFFYLAALLAYLQFLGFDAAGSAGQPSKDAARPDAGPNRWGTYGLAIGLYVCALFSKSVTCSLPLVILLLIWWKRGHIRWRDLLWLLPLLALGVAMGWTTWWTEKHPVGARGEEWMLTLTERCLVAGRDVWFYAGKLVWPWKLVFIYPRWQIDPDSWREYVYPLGAAGVIGALWAGRNRWGRGPLVAVLWFVISLGPALGLFDVYFFRFSFVADHFQYLASLGMIALAAGVIARVLSRSGRWLGPAGHAVCAGLLVVLACLTWNQAHVYRDLETLLRDTLRKNPDAWMAHDLLGNIVMQQGHLSEAMSHFERALQLKPDYAEAHNNLGIALERAGRIPEAIAHFEQAVRVRPYYPEPYYNLGIAFDRLGQTQKAVACYEQAVRLKPDFVDAQNALGCGLLKLNRVTDAIGHWEQAVRLDPGFAEARNNLGSAWLGLGKVADAIQEYEQAVRLRPDYAKAHYNLATALEQEGRTAEAIKHYEQALRVQPDFVEARNRLARLRVAQPGIDP
jgi:tetratricopeptide (TPR) repeat protein